MLNTWRAAFFCKIWRRCVGKKMDLGYELAKFKAYREHGSWFPDTNIPDKLKDLATPWPIRLLAQLMERFHMSEKEAMATPMRIATVLYCARAEMAGEIELFTEQDESNFKKARDLMAAADADPKGWDF